MDEGTDFGTIGASIECLQRQLGLMLDRTAELHVWLEEHLGVPLGTVWDVLLLEPADAL